MRSFGIFLVFFAGLAGFAKGQTYFTVFNGTTFPNGTCYGNCLIGGTVDNRFLSLTNTLPQRGCGIIRTTLMRYPIISFRLYTQGGTGGEGLAFSYGSGMSTCNTARTQPLSLGFGNNLIVSFKTKNDSWGTSGMNIYVNGFGSAPFLSFPFTGKLAAWTQVVIQIDPPAKDIGLDNTNPTSALLSISLGGWWVVTNMPIDNWNPDPSWAFAFSASTVTGSTDNHRVDTIRITIQRPDEVKSVVLVQSSSMSYDVANKLIPDVALAAAQLTVRGPPYSIRKGALTYRVGTPRGRKLLQTGTSPLIYAQEIIFTTTNGTDATTLARNFALAMNSDAVRQTFDSALKSTADLLQVAATTTTYTWGGGLYQPKLFDFLVAASVLQPNQQTVASTVYNMMG